MFTVLEMSNTTRPKAEPKYVTYDYFQQQLKSIDNATKQYTRNYINNTVSAIQSNVVNYSALSNQSKSLTDGVRTIDFDSITQSIQFRTNINQTTTPIKIHPITNTINNVSKINFNDTSTITGITSDSSNTDPTKAISANILTDLNSRFTALETKTQNQTASENETVFTGNVTADTFNGYHLGFNNRFYTLPAIPYVNTDLVMEVGRYIDFHYNAASGTDYTSRLRISKPGTLYYDHSFIVSADIKARNCISDNGNLHDAINKIAALETKNTEQDTRLDTLESKDIAHEERLGSIEAMDTAQNETISNINTKNDEQDERLDTIDKTKLTISYPNVNATATVESIDENNDLRTNLRFKVNIIFDDPHYIPIFTNESKAIATFRYCYASPEHSGYDKSAVIWANRSNGENVITSDEGTIESYDIRVGAIEIILNITLPYEAYLEEAYDPYYLYWAVSPHPTSDEYIISKNLACDNEERLSSTETKNTEQDTRLDTLETKNTEQDTRLDTLESKDIAFEERIGSIEAMDTAQNETLNNINTKNTEQDERLDALYKNKMYVTYEGGTVAPDITREITPELSEELTAVFNIKLTLTFEDKTQPPTLATGTERLLHYIITYYIIENGEQKLIQADNIISYKNENGNVTWYSTVGFTLNNAIIEKGKISFDLSYKRSNHDEPSMWNGSFAGSNRYFKGSVLTQPTINEYFISKNLAYDNEERLSAATNKNNEQDVRLNGFDDSLVGLDNRLNTLESNQITLTMKKFEHYKYNILGTASFANNIFTFVFEEQPTTGSINFIGDFFDGNETLPSTDFTMFFTNGAYSKMEIVYKTGILTNVFQGEYNSTTLTFKLFGNNGNQSLNSFEESSLSIHMPNEKVITRTQDTKSLNILSDDLADNNVYSASKLLDIIYPVGSIYLTFNQSPPAIGTWELISGGYFLQSTTTSSGETGGSTTHSHKTADHVLTVGEMPKHKHTFKGNKITGTVYDIMKYDTTGQTNKDPEGAFSVNRYGSRTWQGTDGSNRAFSLTFTATPTGTISYEGNNQPHNHGNTEAEYHIPPYITCFMYKRTA